MDSLHDIMQQYIDEGIYPFHIPGHKASKSGKFSPYSFDLTEIPGLDNLHNPQGIIKISQQLAAKTFGANDTFFLVNGSSCGIMAAIYATCEDMDTALVARNCHISVFKGLVVAGAAPKYIYPGIINSFDIMGGIDKDSVLNALKADNTIKAVIITSPTYEGITSNIKDIADIVHGFNIPLIVDEAHGSHFKFNEAFPETALEQGADIVIQSLHKTLTSLGQSALIHVKSEIVDIERLAFVLTMFQTTSPSYLIMASIDNTRKTLDEEGDVLFSEYVNLLKHFRGKAKMLNNIKLLDESVIGSNFVDGIDIGKLVLNSANGLQLDEILKNNYKMQAEMSNAKNVVLATSVNDTLDIFADLFMALDEIDGGDILKQNNAPFSSYSKIEANVCINPKNALKFHKKSVSLKDSSGLIAGESIMAFPPGIPFVLPGEMITDEIIENIYMYLEASTQLSGVRDGNVRVIDA